MEKWGEQTFDNAQLKEMLRQHPKAAELNRNIMSVLLNYTSGNAKARVEYGTEIGSDAWRRLYHHYLPFVADLQQILIQEFYSLIPVTENNTDSFFNNVERIIELYIKAGRAHNAIDEKWIKVAVLRDLPTNITKDLAMQLKIPKMSMRYAMSLIFIYMITRQVCPEARQGPCCA